MTEELTTEQKIYIYQEKVHNEAMPGIKRELEKRGWDGARIINRYVVEKPSTSDTKQIYAFQCGGEVFELEVTRSGSKFWGYNNDIGLRTTDELPWYDGDEGSAASLNGELSFGDIEVGSFSQNTEGYLLKIGDYRGPGVYVTTDRSSEMGEVGVHIDIQPEMVNFKVRYFINKR